MTVAICLKCGTYKDEAWAACTKCGHVPEDIYDKARHFMVTDRYFNPVELEVYSAKIAQGETVIFDPVSINSVMCEIEKQERVNTRVALRAGKRIRILTGIAVILIIAIIACIIYLRHG